MLSKLGHEVFHAENGSIALDVYEKSWKYPNLKKFNICLMDISMPV